MRCPQCRSPRPRVLETRTRTDAVVRRRYQCLRWGEGQVQGCGHRFTTWQKPGGRQLRRRYA
jgi:transcriptional regulator NrdR family protein